MSETRTPRAFSHAPPERQAFARAALARHEKAESAREANNGEGAGDGSTATGGG